MMASPQACARILKVGPGQPYATLSGANGDADTGDTIQIAPGEYADCAVLSANHLTVEGIGKPGKVVLVGKTCLGKGILVIHGADITIRNLTLALARVPDGNGAGIRAEGGNLTVESTIFLDNQDGILTNADPFMDVRVIHSQFIGNGVCLSYCAHAIYAGRIASLTVQDSLFRDTKEGHDIKSRAARTEVVGCDIADGPAGTASYLIEAPNGGAVIVRANTLEKGPKSGNLATAISIGAEGLSQPTPEILVEGNHFTNDTGGPTVLLRNLTGTSAVVNGNVLHGKVVLSASQ